MPKEVFAASLENVALRDYEDRPLEAGQIRIRSEYGAAKHGTEFALLRGYAGARGPWDDALKVFKGPGQGPQPWSITPGNMIVGRVEETGSAAGQLKKGDRVLTYGPLRQTLTKDGAPGIWGDGRVLAAIPEDLDWRSAVCLDPAGFALDAVRDGGLRAGDAVAVFGLGAIGLLAVQVAKLAGASVVIGVDPLEERRRIAGELGAGVLLDPAACDAGVEIKKATAHRGADVVIEYSGNRRALQAALRGVAYGGSVVCGAFPPPYDAGLDFGAESHMNRPRIVFTRACSEPNQDHPRWDQARLWRTCFEWIKAGRLRGEAIVHPVVAFPDAPEAYRLAVSRPDSSLKLGVRFG